MAEANPPRAAEEPSAWRLMDMRSMIAGVGGRLSPQHRHSVSPTSRRRREAAHSHITQMLSLGKHADESQPGAGHSAVETSELLPDPRPGCEQPNLSGVQPQTDGRICRFAEPSSSPSTARAWTVDGLKSPSPGTKHVASKLVKFYGETVLCVAFSPDEQLFAVAGQLGHVVLYDTLTGDELFRYKLPRKVGVAALLLTGTSDDLQVLFGTFSGEFHAFRFCLSSLSIYEPQPKARSVTEPSDTPVAVETQAHSTSDAFLSRMSRWSNFSGHNSRHSRSSTGSGPAMRSSKTLRQSKLSRSAVSASEEVSQRRPGAELGLLEGEASAGAPAHDLTTRRHLVDAGKTAMSQARAAIVRGVHSPKPGPWAALAGDAMAVPGGDEAVGSSSLLPSAWKQAPFSWNDMLANCALECLARSAELNLLFMAGKTENIAVYEHRYDEENDLVGFVKKPMGMTHCAKVTSIGIGAEGQMLAVGGESHTLELYAAATGQLLRSIVMQTQTASLSLARDGSLLAVGTASSVKLFSIRWAGPGSQDVPHASKTLELPQGVSAGMVAFSEDGSNLAVAGEIGQERVVSIVSTSTGATMRQARFSERVRCCALDANGGRLLIGTFARTAELYYGGSGATMRHFGSSNDTVRCVFMHPARSLLAIAGDAHGNGTVYVYHVKAAKQRGNSPVFRLPRRKPVWSVNISPDALWLTVGGYDARIAVYSLRSLFSRAAQYGGDVSEVTPLQEISFQPEKGGPGFIWSSGFSDDGSTFVVGSWSGTAYVYDVSAEATAAEKALAEEDAAVAAATVASRASAQAPAEEASRAALDAVERLAEDLPNAGGPGIDWSAGSNVALLTERCQVRFTRGERVYAVAVSASGEQMAVAGRDAKVLMYSCPKASLDEGRGRLSKCASRLDLGTTPSVNFAPSMGCVPRKLWTAEGRDFVYTVALTDQYCAFAGTGRMVYVVSAKTGDMLLSLPIAGTIQSLYLHHNALAIGVQEAGIVAVYDVATSVELICLPSVFGAVHCVKLDDEALTIASGHQATMYGGGGDFAWSQVPDYYVAAALIHGEKHISLRCLASILRRHPEIVNCRHPRDRHTFLQYATLVVTEPAVMSLLVGGPSSSPAAATSTKIGLLPDVHGDTALDTALRMGRRTWVRLLVDAVISGRVLSLPSSVEPVVRCFPQLAREHPKDFIRLISRMPLTLQHEMFWPWVTGPIDGFLTKGTTQPILTHRWRLRRTAIEAAWEAFTSMCGLFEWMGSPRHRARGGTYRSGRLQPDRSRDTASAASCPSLARPDSHGSSYTIRGSSGGGPKSELSNSRVIFEDMFHGTERASLDDTQPHLVDESSPPPFARDGFGGSNKRFRLTRRGSKERECSVPPIALPAEGISQRDRMRQLLLGAEDGETLREMHERFSIGHDSDMGRLSTSTTGTSDNERTLSPTRGAGSSASLGGGHRGGLPARFISMLRAGAGSTACVNPLATSRSSSTRNLHRRSSQDWSTPSRRRFGEDSSALGDRLAVDGVSNPSSGRAPRRGPRPAVQGLQRRRSSITSFLRRSLEEHGSLDETSSQVVRSSTEATQDGKDYSMKERQVVVDINGTDVDVPGSSRSPSPQHRRSSCRESSTVGLCLTVEETPALQPPPPNGAPSAEAEPRRLDGPIRKRSSLFHSLSLLSVRTDKTDGERTDGNSEHHSVGSPAIGQSELNAEIRWSAASGRDFEEEPRPFNDKFRKVRAAIRGQFLVRRMLAGSTGDPLPPWPAFRDSSVPDAPVARTQSPDWQEIRARRRTSVRVYTVPWRGWASRVGSDAPLALLVDAVRATNDRSAFQSVAVQALLEFKWRAFGRLVFATLLIIYLIGMIATILQAITASRMLVLRHGLSDGEDSEVEQYWYEMTKTPAARGLAGPPVNELDKAACMPGVLRITSVAEAWNASHNCQTLRGLHLFLPLFVITSIRGLFFLYLESVQVRQTSMKGHLKEHWNFFDTLNALLPLAVNALMLVPGTWTPSPDGSQPPLCYMLRVLLAASCLLGGIKLLWYTRASFRIGPLVTMFVEILSTNVLPFLLILTITIFSFAFALHVLVGPRDIYFANPISAMFTAWGMSLYVRTDHNHMTFRGAAADGVDFFGMNSVFTHGLDDVISVELIIYELLMVLVQIVLLNLLIAIMSDTYTRARARIALTSRYEKAQIIWELELYTSWFHGFIPTWIWSLFLAEGETFESTLFPDWLHFCLPDDAKLVELDLLPPSYATGPSRGDGTQVTEGGRTSGAGSSRSKAAGASEFAPLGLAYGAHEGRGVDGADEATQQGFKDTSIKILGLKAYLLKMLDALGVDGNYDGVCKSGSSALGKLQADVSDLTTAFGELNARLEAAFSK